MLISIGRTQKVHERKQGLLGWKYKKKCLNHGGKIFIFSIFIHFCIYNFFYLYIYKTGHIYCPYTRADVKNFLQQHCLLPQAESNTQSIQHPGPARLKCSFVGMRRQDVFESFQMLSAHLRARLTDKPQHCEALITYRHIPDVSAITLP